MFSPSGHLKVWLLGLCLDVLGHDSTYFGGPGTSSEQTVLVACTDSA